MAKQQQYLTPYDEDDGLWHLVLLLPGGSKLDIDAGYFSEEAANNAGASLSRWQQAWHEEHGSEGRKK